MKRRPPIKIKYLLAAVAAFLISLSVFLERTHIPVPHERPVPEAPLKIPIKETEPARILRVHDGDTVSLSYRGRRYKVRLIGIDAPELGQRPWGFRSKEHLKELLTERVSIEMDVQGRDKYGRLLAYLRKEDGTLINEAMVEDGYAVLLTIPPNVKYVDELKEAQTEARHAQRGIWGEDGLTESPSDYRERTQ